MKAPGRRIAATVTRGAVGCSAWLGVAVELGIGVRVDCMEKDANGEAGLL